MSWRPVLGVLALGLVAVGLSMRGVSAEKAAPPVAAPATATPASPTTLAEVPTGPLSPPSEPLAEVPFDGATPNKTRRLGGKGIDPNSNYNQFDTWVGGLPPSGVTPVRVEASSLAPESPDGGTAGPPPTGACQIDNGAGACICVDNETAACPGVPGGTYLGNGSTCVDDSTLDCDNNGACDLGGAPDCNMNGVPDFCDCRRGGGTVTDCDTAPEVQARVCPVRACCTLAGVCTGDSTQSVCEGAGNTWHPYASCANYPNAPYSQALPNPVCNVQGTCDWDNGTFLDDRGRPRNEHFLDALFTSAVADDFILRDTVNPNNPCLMTDAIVHWTHQIPPDVQVFDGVNVTVYEDLVQPTRCLTDADCVVPGGVCVGTNCDTMDCFCAADPKGPAGRPLAPTNAAQFNTHVSDQPGGVVYSQFISFSGVPVANAGLCDPGQRICIIRLPNIPCGEEISRVEVDLDPASTALPEIAPLILNKNRKYWFEMQAVTGDDPDTVQTTWFVYQSERNTGHQQLRGFGTAIPFWTNDLGNANSSEPGCASPPADTRQDMNFQLLGTKLPAIPPVGNDLCANRFTVSDGAVGFDSTGATTDGTAPGGGCLPAPADNIDKDLWYEYTASCLGLLTVDTCGSAFDTVVALYQDGTPCPATTVVACNNDSTSCGAGSLQSSVTTGAIPNETFVIRVGGRNGASGKGRLSIRCEDVCGDPDAENCCMPTMPFAPGCTEAACCNIICELDPGCCGDGFPFVWDTECGDLANSEPACRCPCDPNVEEPTPACNRFECLGGAICPTPEVCGNNNINGGCLVTPHRFTNISCGQTICGELFAGPSSRDNDWFQFTIADADMDGGHGVKLTLVSDIPAAAQIQQGFCAEDNPPTDPETYGFASTASCEPDIHPDPEGPLTSICLEPGTYYIWVVPASLGGVIIDTGFSCGTQNKYKFTLDCVEACQTGACCSCSGATCFDGDNFLECDARMGNFNWNPGDLCTDVPSPCVPHGIAAAQTVTCDSTFTFDNTNLAPCTVDADCPSGVCDELPGQDQCRIPEDPDYSCDFEGPHTGTRWFKFVATDSTARIETCDSAFPASDSIIELYTVGATGDLCESIMPVATACGEDECGPNGFLTSFCATGLTPGTTYYMQFSSWDPDTLGSYTIRISCPCVGACCDTNADTCVDNAAQDACTTRFEADTLCADLVPPCGDGACCVNGTCNGAALTLAQCNTAGGDWSPGANCAQIVCNLRESCDWDNGTTSFLGRAHSTQWSNVPGSEADTFFFEVADDFNLRGDTQTETNGCEIESVRALLTHFNHTGDDIPPGPCDPGGSPGACFDTPEDYVSIRVTIYEDTGGAFLGGADGKGPAGQPNDPPDGGHNGMVVHEVVVTDGPRKGPPPAPGNWFEYDPIGTPPDLDFDIRIHFDPPLVVEKNKKMWLAIAPELGFDVYYQTAWVRSNKFNGNRGYQFLDMDGEGVYGQVEPASPQDPVDFIFQINGDKEAVGCGECQLYGDIVPAAGGPNLDPGNCVVDLDDILCVLDDFANVNSCAGNGNVAPCVPNVVVDLDDILAILDAFAGDYACPHPCPPPP